MSLLDEAAAVYRTVYQRNKLAALGVSLIHGEDKFPARSSTVLIGLPPALRS